MAFFYSTDPQPTELTHPEDNARNYETREKEGSLQIKEIIVVVVVEKGLKVGWSLRGAGNLSPVSVDASLNTIEPRSMTCCEPVLNLSIKNL